MELYPTLNRKLGFTAKETFMKRKVRVIVLLLGIICLTWPGNVLAQQKKSVNERILEILIEKNIITKDQYEDLLQQAKEEESDKPETRKTTFAKMEKEDESPRATAGFKRGFYVESADKRSRILFRGRLHSDFKGYLGDNPQHDSFFIRRARLALAGRVYQYYAFRIEAEFAKGGARLNDAFVNFQYYKPVQFIVGQFKVPFSMEEMHSDNWIDFMERSIANKISPSRDIGMMFHGGIGDQIFYYQLGYFNGYKLNKPSDADDGKDLAGRAVVAPFLRSGSKAVEGLRLGVSFTWGNENLAKNQWWNSGNWTTAAGTIYMGMSDGVVQNGTRIRGGAELYWDWGSTKLQSEYMIVKLGGLENGAVRNDYNIWGGYVSLSHCLTGEKFVFKNGKPGRIIPLRPFRLNGGGWGAFQVGARLEQVKGDRGLLTQGFVDPSQYTNRAAGVTFGINWYPVDMVRVMLNYYHMDFGDSIAVGDTTIDNEDVIMTRVELAL